MITDSNYVCLAKMTGRRFQEESNTEVDTVRGLNLDPILRLTYVWF